MTQQQERRVTDAGFRAGDDAPTLEGYAAVFESEAVIAGQFREVIERGAFDDALTDDVRALVNHDPNLILGRTTAGTLRLSVDERGLKYEIDAPDTSYGRDLVTSVKRGDVTQSSFAFRVVDDTWDRPRSEMPLRRIRKVELFDVSPVTYPAYTSTVVSARAQDMAKDLSERDAQELEAARWRLRWRTRA